MQIDTDTLLPLPMEGVELNSPALERHVIFRGLSEPEEHGRWTVGPRVRLAFRLPYRPESGVVLRLESLGCVARGHVDEQVVEFLAHGQPVSRWHVTSPVMAPRTLALPPEAIEADGSVMLELRIATCVQPAALGLGWAMTGGCWACCCGGSPGRSRRSGARMIFRPSTSSRWGGSRARASRRRSGPASGPVS